MKIATIKQQTFNKSYLKGMTYFEFENISTLIYELFYHNSFKDTYADDAIFEYIETFSYSKISDIPKDELKMIESYYFELKKNNENDEEKLTYLLLAAILKKEVLVTVDETVIEDMNSEIQLHFGSVISFIKVDKFKNQRFTTL